MNTPATLAAVLLASAFAGSLCLAQERLAAGRPFELAAGRDAQQRFPAVAALGETFLCVWQEGSTAAGDDGRIVASIVRDGVPGEPLVICAGRGVRERPAVAAAADGFLVAWQDLRGPDSDVYAARVSADGKLLDPDGIAVAAGKGSQRMPAVASDGAGFLVAWQSTVGGEPTRIEAARLAGGKLADAKPLDLGAGCTPAAAFGGQKYLVVWDAGFRERVGAVEGVFLPPAGAAGKPFRVMQICCDAPSVAAGKDGFVVVASRQPAPNPWGWSGPAGFVCAQVGFDGSAPQADLAYGYYHVELAARARPNILDSSQWRDSPDRWPAGKVGGFPGTQNGRWPHLYSTIASVGDAYLAAWVNRKLRNRWELAEADVYGSLVRTDPWRVAAVGGDALAAGDLNESHPRLAAAGRRLLLVYEQVRPDGRLSVAARPLEVK